MTAHKCPKCQDTFPTFDKLTNHIVQRHPDFVALLKKKQAQRGGNG